MLVLNFVPVTKILAYVLFILFGIWVWFQWKHRKVIQSASKMYSMKYRPLPFIGHAHLALDWGRISRILMEVIEDTLSKGFSAFCFWCGPWPLKVVLDADEVQKILNSSSTMENLDEMQFLEYACGQGLAIARHSLWRITRRHLNPMFLPKNIEQLMPMFNRNSRELVLMLSQVEGTTVNFLDYTMKISLKSVCNLIFGSNVIIDMESEEFRKLIYVVERIPDLFIKRVIRPWLRIECLFKFLYKKELHNITNTLETFTSGIIKEVRKKQLNNKESLGLQKDVAQISDSPETGPSNLLDTFKTLQIHLPHFTDKELKDEAAVFYCTGTDTVAATVATLLLALAQYPEIQEKLLDEINSTIEADADVTREDLDRLPYLDQVYRETLRWSTIVPLIGRKATGDLELKSCSIRAGSTVIIGIGGVLTDPKTYQDPKRFDPERFSSENISDKIRSAFLPFSGGPRSCIGKIYANMLIKTMVIHVLRQFKLSTKMDMHSVKKKLMVSLISAEGYLVKIEKRNAKNKK